MAESLSYSPHHELPREVLEIPTPIVRSLGKVLRNRSHESRIALDDQLHQLEMLTNFDSHQNNILSVARSSKSDLDVFINELTRAKTARIEVYNDKYVNLIVEPDEKEYALPDNIDIELKGSLYHHLIDTIDHGIHTRIQTIKASQRLRQEAPVLIKNITSSANQISHSLEDLNCAEGVRITTELLHNTISTTVQLYID